MFRLALVRSNVALGDLFRGTGKSIRKNFINPKRLKHATYEIKKITGPKNFRKKKAHLPQQPKHATYEIYKITGPKNFRKKRTILRGI
jgi:hypothetical protein